MRVNIGVKYTFSSKCSFSTKCTKCIYGRLFICRYCMYSIVLIFRYCIYSIVFIGRYCIYSVVFICRYCIYSVVFICRYCIYKYPLPYCYLIEPRYPKESTILLNLTSYGISVAVAAHKNPRNSLNFWDTELIFWI